MKLNDKNFLLFSSLSRDNFYIYKLRYKSFVYVGMTENIQTRLYHHTTDVYGSFVGKIKGFNSRYNRPHRADIDFSILNIVSKEGRLRTDELLIKARKIESKHIKINKRKFGDYCLNRAD